MVGVQQTLPPTRSSEPGTGAEAVVREVVSALSQAGVQGSLGGQPQGCQC